MPYLRDAGNADIAGALLAIGAGVNGHGAWQNTPLHIAAFEGHIAALRTLLGAGADLWALNDRGQTPSEVNAVYNGSRKVQTLFEEAREMRHLIAAGENKSDKVRDRILVRRLLP